MQGCVGRHRPVLVRHTRAWNSGGGRGRQWPREGATLGVLHPHNPASAVQLATYLHQLVHLCCLLMALHHCLMQQRQDRLYTTMQVGCWQRKLSEQQSLCVALLVYGAVAIGRHTRTDRHTEAAPVNASSGAAAAAAAAACKCKTVLLLCLSPRVLLWAHNAMFSTHVSMMNTTKGRSCVCGAVCTQIGLHPQLFQPPNSPRPQSGRGQPCRCCQRAYWKPS
jgi:hypothetical protein